MNKQQHQIKPTRIRLRILALIFGNVIINYMDRSNISVAASEISKDLQLTPVQLGLVFSAFGWTYAGLQIPGGLLADRIKPRILYTFCLVSWSAVTFMQGLIHGFATLFGLRLATGAFEAPSYPINNRVVTSWFPEQERASAIATYTSGQFVGLAFLTPLLATIQHFLTWRGLFIITGAAGILWGLAWYCLYRDPREHKKVNAAELEHLEQGGAVLDKPASTNTAGNTAFTKSGLREVFSHRKLWGIYIGQFCAGATMWFFLTWFPTYLVKYRGMDFLTSGFLASVPFLAAFGGVLLSGFLSDYLLKKGISAGVARKAPIITGLILSIFIVGANYVDRPWLIILFMAIAFFGNGLAAISWIFISTLAPKHLIGLTGGVFNFIGNLSSVVVPLVIGYLVSAGNFEPALVFVGILACIGACSYIFLIGKVERIE
ncbi:MAG TPA: MFS transporter, partial [Chitinophagaceae bacterium]|nr:MFS transporter [Chitinophagaceae bacterium]